MVKLSCKKHLLKDVDMKLMVFENHGESCCFQAVDDTVQAFNYAPVANTSHNKCALLA